MIQTILNNRYGYDERVEIEAVRDVPFKGIVIWRLGMWIHNGDIAIQRTLIQKEEREERSSREDSSMIVMNNRVELSDQADDTYTWEILHEQFQEFTTLVKLSGFFVYSDKDEAMRLQMQTFLQMTEPKK